VDHQQRQHGHSVTRNPFASLVTTSVHAGQTNAFLLSPLVPSPLTSSQPSSSPPSSASPLTTKRSTGDMVGVYAAMTGRPALITSTAVTTVEAFFLPLAALVPMADDGVGMEALWRKAAADLILSCFPSKLRLEAQRSPTAGLTNPISDTVLAQRMVEAARFLPAALVPFAWSPLRHRALLLLHGSLGMAVTAEQRMSLQAPAWIEGSQREEKGSGSVIHMHAAKGALALMWGDVEVEDGEDERPDPEAQMMMRLPLPTAAMSRQELSASAGEEDELIAASETLRIEVLPAREEEKGIVMQIEMSPLNLNPLCADGRSI
jgi:hypothetical protein